MVMQKMAMSGIVLGTIMAIASPAAANIINMDDIVIPANSSTKTKNSVDSLAAEIAKLEITRVLLLSRYVTTAPQIVATDNKIQAARKYYIKAGGNNKLLQQTIANALVIKIANSEVETALLYASYAADTPKITVAELNLQGLRDRLSQLQLHNSKVALNSAISQALNHKISQLQQDLIPLKAKYHRDAVIIVYFEEKIKVLQTRLAKFS